MTDRWTYSAHQPDLLPYSGFWYKMAMADLFDLKIWDQYVDKGYQRRVKMRDTWVNVPLVKSSSTASIYSKRLQPGAVENLVDQIVTRYTWCVKKPPMWDKVGMPLMAAIREIKTDQLWDLNVQLIMMVREILGITTPLTFSKPARADLRGSDGIVDVIKTFPPNAQYLSGTGGRAYMGDCKEFTDADIPVIWSKHEALTGDSILSVIFDHEDPMPIILNEHEGEA